MILKSNKFLVPAAIFAAGLLIAGALLFVNKDKLLLLSDQEAAAKVIEYIDGSIVSQGGTEKATLNSITEEKAVYKINFNVGQQVYDMYVSKDGKYLFPGGYDMTITPQGAESQTQAEEEKIVTIGNFTLSNQEICKENGKPIVYFFGSQSCPHCQWEDPIMKEVMSKFGENIVFKNNMDTNNDTDIFAKYSTGGIPTLVLGCRYSRVGSGESIGPQEEAKVLTALACRLTENQPADVCGQVEDLINQIK